MNYTIEAPFTLSESQRATVDEKLNKLTVYNNDITNIDVYFKEADGKIPGEVECEIRVFLPGNDIFVQHKESSLLKAFSSTYDSVKRQAKKVKDKQHDKQAPINEMIDIVNMNM